MPNRLNLPQELEKLVEKRELDDRRKGADEQNTERDARQNQQRPERRKRKRRQDDRQ